MDPVPYLKFGCRQGVDLHLYLPNLMRCIRWNEESA